MDNVTAFNQERPQGNKWDSPSYLPDTQRTAKQYGPTALDQAIQAVAAISMITLMLIGCII